MMVNADKEKLKQFRKLIEKNNLEETQAKRDIKRGEIYFANFDNDNNVGSEQTGNRYVLVIQNNIGNHHSGTVVVAFITSKPKTNLPTHYNIMVNKPSTILCEQIRTIDKVRLTQKRMVLSEKEMAGVDNCIRISLGLKK